MEIKHFVAFKYRPELEQRDKEVIAEKFLQLKDHCLKDGRPYIKSLIWGLANSPEGLDQGMEHGYLVTFENKEDRDFYVKADRAHAEFVDYIKQRIAGVFVFDFEVASV